MIHIDHHQGPRSLKKISHTTDFAIVGGGLAGTCAAIQAAREGLSVVLIQDRPMLGGNASEGRGEAGHPLGRRRFHVQLGRHRRIVTACASVR